MITIRKATIHDYAVLAKMGKETFLDAHGHSAPQKDIDIYTEAKYSHAAMQAELNDPDNLYHIIYYNDQPAGYSKIVLDSPNADIADQHITKLERIYVLKEFYRQKLGSELLSCNLTLSKNNGQSGIWLYVWVENERAFNFYLHQGFRIAGRYDFSISENHTNPNYVMYLKY